MILIILKALIIGFCVAAPVGPIGVLCIHRSLRDGFLHGFISGLGAALADATYGCVAAFGLTFISTFLVNHQFLLKSVGAIFLGYLGLKIFLSKPSKQKDTVKEKDKNKKLWHVFAATFFLTLANPATILSFTAIFAGLGLGSLHLDYDMAAALVIGVFLGSLLWWLLLSGTVSIIHSKIKTNILKWANVISGSIFLTFSAIVFISLFT